MSKTFVCCFPKLDKRVTLPGSHQLVPALKSILTCDQQSRIRCPNHWTSEPPLFIVLQHHHSISMCNCNRERRHFKDYPCHTFTFAKQYDYELPSIGNRVTFSSGLSATGSNPAHTFVSGANGYLNKDTLPVRWESPDVIASTSGQRLSRQLNSEFTGCHFGSQKWDQSGTAAEDGRRHGNSFVVDVHPPTMPNHYVCHNIAAAVNGKRASTESILDYPRLLVNSPVSMFSLSDEFCLKVVEDAFKDIVY